MLLLVCTLSGAFFLMFLPLDNYMVCYNMILFNSLLSFACYFGVDLFLYRSDLLYACGLSLLLVSLPLFYFLVDYITDRIVFR